MRDVARQSGPEVRLVQHAPEDTVESGLRVNWQSEDDRIEAAGFLIATRLQEDVRRRIAKQTLTRRERNREKFSTLVAQQSGD